MKKITEKKPGKFRSALLDWLGVPIDLMNTQFWNEVAGPKVAGQTVNEQTVLQLAAVWSCVRLIAETISTLPLPMYEKGQNGIRRAVDDDPLGNIIRNKPNADSTATVFWEAMIVAMLLRGNGMAEMKMIGDRLVSLVFLKPGRLQITKDGNGNRIYRYNNDDGTQRVIPPSRIFRIPGFTLDGDWGVSAVQYGASVFGAALGAANAANSTFEKGMAPTVAFTLPGKVNPQQRDEFDAMVARKTGALQAGTPVVLENGMTADNIGINPKDAQLLESRNFGVEEICRWFRVPPWMVGHTAGSTNWGTGIEQQMIGFLTFTLRPWLKRIEDHINAYLIPPGQRSNRFVEFNVEGLLRADSTARAAFLGGMVDRGIMTRDEARAKENLEPMGGNAGVLMAQTAMAPINSSGEPQQ